MKRQIIEKARQASPSALNVLREELQWLILGGLHSGEAFRDIAFLGGTCLRLCHGLQRFSEDLNFSVLDGAHGDAERWFYAVGQYLLGQGFAQAEVVCSKPRASVVTGTVRFTGLLFEAGISPHADQKLTIKIEIDRRPPHGASTQQRIVAMPSLMALTLYDLPSLMAGKVHAALARPFTKGRDWYDIVWYGSKGVQPNLKLLANALQQIPTDCCQDASAWKAAIVAKSASLDWQQARKDFQPFLEHANEAELLTHQTIETIFGGM